jgi:hypothetical protein
MNDVIIFCCHPAVKPKSINLHKCANIQLNKPYVHLLHNAQTEYIVYINTVQLYHLEKKMLIKRLNRNVIGLTVIGYCYQNCCLKFKFNLFICHLLFVLNCAMTIYVFSLSLYDTLWYGNALG